MTYPEPFDCGSPIDKVDEKTWQFELVKPVKYPVAETFGSIQGEGIWTGTPMFFIRLAGCNVGKYEKPSEMDDLHLGSLRIFNSNHSICQTEGGEKFLCDTDYYKRFELTAEELLAQSFPYQHICLTGGEPFIHAPEIFDLVKMFRMNSIQVHIETSGTKPIPQYKTWNHPFTPWVTCSPKIGFDRTLLGSNEVDEWKILAGPKFDEERTRTFEKLDFFKRPLFIQPIGDINSHLKENVQRCLELLKRNPTWRLSAQLHKYLELR